ncbi:HAD hydrolase-like protein [Thermophagus xiamenensis]|nr:HAD hydrolase-like protein [Thermophagus xiamenensis]
MSNSSLTMMKEQLSNVAIFHLFDAYYSVDQVKKIKPFKDIYLFSAKQEELNTKDIVMVAMHD